MTGALVERGGAGGDVSGEVGADDDVAWWEG